ncbi:MAG TPA: hypothetical protein VFF73_14555 [Planctomycetota bacterium]|nr:hypothetical protein [Planctomycetota bacterium]
MSCDEFFEALMDGDRLAEREEQMKTCPSCRARAGRIEGVDAALKNPEKVKVDVTGLRERVLAAVRETGEQEPAAPGGEVVKFRGAAPRAP